MLDCNIFPGLDRDYLEHEVNLFLLPILENDGDDALTRAGLNFMLIHHSSSHEYTVERGCILGSNICIAIRMVSYENFHNSKTFLLI